MILKNKNILIFLSIGIVLIVSIFFVFNNKQEYKELPQVKLKDNKTNKKLAILVEKNTQKGTYEEWQSDSFPSTGYRLNMTKSGCVDSNNKIIENAISYKDGNVTVETGSTSYCYLYFDEEENLSNICEGSTMQECLNNKANKIDTIANLNANQADLYRYQGTRDEVVNNYICFGTKDKEECTSNPEQYMYRILGITTDGKLKLIKNYPIKEGNTTKFLWHNTNQVKTYWGESDLFKRINGISEEYSNIFLNSTEYPYLQKEEWLNKIEISDWYQGFTRGGRVQSLTTYQVYQMETGKIDTNYNDLIDGQIKNINDRFIPLEDAKISLMNISDYNYATQKDGCNCIDYHIECSQNWLHIFGKNSLAEKISTAYGYLSNYWGSFKLYYNLNETGDGWIMDGGMDGIVRPIFFLSNSVRLSKLGTMDSPYIIN